MLCAKHSRQIAPARTPVGQISNRDARHYSSFSASKSSSLMARGTFAPLPAVGQEMSDQAVADAGSGRKTNSARGIDLGCLGLPEPYSSIPNVSHADQCRRRRLVKNVMSYDVRSLQRSRPARMRVIGEIMSSNRRPPRNSRRLATLHGRCARPSSRTQVPLCEEFCPGRRRKIGRRCDDADSGRRRRKSMRDNARSRRG